MSFSGTRDPARKSRKPKVTIHYVKERNLEEPEWGAIKKEVATKTFEPVELDSAHLGKMIKRKDGQKLNHKEREIRNKRTPEWKVNHGLLKK